VFEGLILGMRLLAESFVDAETRDYPQHSGTIVLYFSQQVAEAGFCPFETLTLMRYKTRQYKERSCHLGAFTP